MTDAPASMCAQCSAAPAAADGAHARRTVLLGLLARLAWPDCSYVLPLIECTHLQIAKLLLLTAYALGENVQEEHRVADA